MLHVTDTTGGRQELAAEGAGPLYFNRPLWVEFLDERLRVPGADNILQENLFIALTFVEMIASARVHSIICISILMPLRWLAGNCHLLSEYNWSERSTGRSIDILERALEKIADGTDEHGPGELMLQDTFMMLIFDELACELPPFKKYLSYMYETKQMSLVGSPISSHQFMCLRNELFSPNDGDNIDSTTMAVELGELAASTILIELRDPKRQPRGISQVQMASCLGATPL